MQEILSSASYVRCDDLAASPPGAIPLEIAAHLEREAQHATQRIWELLETPQTVATICRVLVNEGELQPQRCEPQVKSFLARLYREDLIQLSPDT
jgi:hypothetical protein